MSIYVFQLQSWNVGGVLTKFEVPDFMPYLLCFNFVCSIETFLEYFENSLFSSDFNVYVSSVKKSSHLGQRSGGVMCLVKHTIWHIR